MTGKLVGKKKRREQDNGNNTSLYCVQDSIPPTEARTCQMSGLPDARLAAAQIMAASPEPHTLPGPRCPDRASAMPSACFCFNLIFVT